MNYLRDVNSKVRTKLLWRSDGVLNGDIIAFKMAHFSHQWIAASHLGRHQGRLGNLVWALALTLTSPPNIETTLLITVTATMSIQNKTRTSRVMLL